MRLLEIDSLSIEDIEKKNNTIVNDVSFHVMKDEIVAIVGESGSGKTLTCKSIVRMLSDNLRCKGSILFEGRSVEEYDEEMLRKYRGQMVHYLPQDVMNAWNPTITIGKQIEETMLVHKIDSLKHIQGHLQTFNLEKTDLDKYPFECSGGMLQRFMIVIAIMLDAKIIIADEPTTALDALNQQEVMRQFSKIKNRTMIIVTHHLGFASALAHRILVMNQGVIVEEGLTKTVLNHPKNEYTKKLVSAHQQLKSYVMNATGGSNDSV